MRIHLIGVSGTGMGSLALLFRGAGHDVSGSDVAFDPPVGPALRRGGVRLLEGYDAAHVDDAIELVVVGNVVRRDNVEARRAEEIGVARTSMSAALRAHFLTTRTPLVVAGTHGKTTTSAMCTWILAQAGLEPGWFIGGLPKNLPSGAGLGASRRKIGAQGSVHPAPFVVEGDEYDDVYWSKKPKFFDYTGVSERDVAIVTSVEHDHVDVYPDAASYEAAFGEFARRFPATGLIVVDARSTRAREIVALEARARTTLYALDEPGVVTEGATWHGALAPASGDTQPFDLFVGGASCGRFALKVPGAHNVRNAIAAIAACTEGFGVSIDAARRALASFEGVRRRQDLLGEPGGVRIYDDFAHHPTAVAETLRALRSRHPRGALWAVFEPRSATACRAIHQAAYREAFDAADRVVLAPLGRSNVPEGERLDVGRLARDLAARGRSARAAGSHDEIVDVVAAEAQSGDTIALLSNGVFGGVASRILAALEARDVREGGGGGGRSRGAP